MGDAYPELVAAPRLHHRAACAARRSASSRRSRRASRCSKRKSQKAVAAGRTAAGGRRRLQALRHLRLPDRSHRRHPRRQAARLRPRRLRSRDERAARARARGVEGQRAGSRRPAATRSSRATSRAASSATRSSRAESRVLALVVEGGAPCSQARAGDAVEVIVEQTPFYAESGGQVGDRGAIETPTGTRRDRGHAAAGGIAGRAPRQGRARRDPRRSDGAAARRRGARAGAVRHHSGTHLLHAALREVLGPNATQRGSLVTPGAAALRLQPRRAGDARSSSTRSRISSTAGSRRTRRPTVEEMPHADAIAAGAIAMFGEKYGDRVRVLTLRRLLEGAVRRHARARHRRHRAVEGRRGRRRRVGRATHRGADGHRSAARAGASRSARSSARRSC